MAFLKRGLLMVTTYCEVLKERQAFPEAIKHQVRAQLDIHQKLHSEPVVVEGGMLKLRQIGEIFFELLLVHAQGDGDRTVVEKELF